MSTMSKDDIIQRARLFQMELVDILARRFEDHCERGVGEWVQRVHNATIILNGRLSSTVGQVRARSQDTAEIATRAFTHEKNFLTSLREVVFHELAHVAVGVQAGHGPRWRAFMALAGFPSASPRISLPVDPRREGPAFFECETCGHTVQLTARRVGHLKRGGTLVHVPCKADVTLKNITWRAAR